MKLTCKIFIENQDNKYILGPGRMELLQAMADLGSLRQAAQKMGMSYRWAWGRLREMEKALGVPLLQQDGPTRGKARCLTEQARQLLLWHEKIGKRIQRALQKAVQDKPDFLNIT